MKKWAKKQKRNQTPKPPLEWPEFALIGILVASVILILTVLLIRASFNPQADAENSMEKLADEYYRGYLYPQLLDYDLERTDRLEKYAERGVPTTYLRQLMDYNSSKHVVAEDVFSNQYYQCDTNHTGVRYYPHEPYGPRDYTVKYLWSCVDKLNPAVAPKVTDWTESIEPSDNQ